MGADPFTPEQHRQGALKSVQVRRQRAANRMRAAETVSQIVARIPADQLPDYFTNGAVGMVEAATAGELEPPENALDRLRYVEAADKLHKMGRLAAGETTSISASFGAHANVDLDALAQRIDQLRAARDARDTALDVQSDASRDA